MWRLRLLQAFKLWIGGRGGGVCVCWWGGNVFGKSLVIPGLAGATCLPLSKQQLLSRAEEPPRTKRRPHQYSGEGQAALLRHSGSFWATLHAENSEIVRKAVCSAPPARADEDDVSGPAHRRLAGGVNSRGGQRSTSRFESSPCFLGIAG